MLPPTILDFDFGINIVNAIGDALGGLTDGLMLVPAILAFTGSFVAFLPNILVVSLTVSLAIGAFKVIMGAA